MAISEQKRLRLEAEEKRNKVTIKALTEKLQELKKRQHQIRLEKDAK